MLLLPMTLLTLAAHCLAAESDSSATPITLPNASFEEVDPSTRKPAPWNLPAGIGSVDDTVARTGKRSVKICFKGPRESGMVVAMIPVPPVPPAPQISNTATGTYRLSVYVRSLDFDGQVQLHVFTYPASTGKNYLSDTLTGTGDWRRLTLDIPAQQSIQSLQVRLNVGGSWGQVWFDDASIEYLPGKQP